ncbi:hypothetical protein L0244_24955 [bacterium]|nr:hypothetical protein [bacterium]MCI0616245.1 hypothetical protein [bacterium]
MKILRSTPILFVDRIEPSLPFWTERLGFTKQTEVPHGDVLGFVILERDGVEMMMQTLDSAKADLPDVAKRFQLNSVSQFMEVDSLDDVLQGLSGYDLLTPIRTTFYGMREAVVADPAGFILVFAQKIV